VIVELTASPIDRIEADALLLFLHSDDRPPPGAPGLVDWRLNGSLSRMLKDGWFAADDGAPLLIASGRRTRASRILVLGLGSRRGAGAPRLRAAARTALAKLSLMGMSRLAVGLPGAAEPPLPEHAQVVAIVEGFLETVRGPQPPETRPHVTLVVPAEAQVDAAAALTTLRTTTGAGYHFDLRPLPAARPTVIRARSSEVS
jgi:hypothetical protein